MFHYKGEVEISVEAPKVFNLYQNYPNSGVFVLVLQTGGKRLLRKILLVK
jgi:hypothetical protein